MKSKKKPIALAGPVRAPGVRLDAAAAANDGGAPAVWLEVAYEGSFKGHWMGEFEFTEATFDEIIANFHSHPQYKPVPESITAEQLEADDYGVVQWDMHHASEAPATSGEIAVVGAPAQGWVLDVRKGKRADGKVKLEALTRWLDRAREYVRNKQYRWASVSVVFNARHPETGKPIGAVLTSIALTNQPFLQDLPALAASSQALLDWYPGCIVNGPESALEAIRGCLALPATAAATEVAAEVSKLRGYAAPGATVPAGVDVDDLVGRFRQILSLPVLATTDEVFAELDKLFVALAAPTQQLAPAGAPNEGTIMSTNATNTPAAKSPADDLRDSIAVALAKHRKCDAKEVTNTQILMAVENGENAAGDLAALLAALDVPNLPKALSQIDALKQLKVKLDELLPKYEAQQAEIARIDEESALEDVGMALASLNIDPKDESKAPIRASLMRDRKANRDKFRTDYKIAEMRQLARAQSATTITTTGGVDPTQALATQRQHTQQTGVADPFAGVRLGAGGQLRVVPQIQDKPGANAAPSVNLSTYDGRNDVERAISYLRTQDATKHLSIDDLNARASQLVADLRRRGRAA